MIGHGARLRSGEVRTFTTCPTTDDTDGGDASLTEWTRRPLSGSTTNALRRTPAHRHVRRAVCTREHEGSQGKASVDKMVVGCMGAVFLAHGGLPLGNGLRAREDLGVALRGAAGGRAEGG
jgi:hypothetical protein